MPIAPPDNRGLPEVVAQVLSQARGRPVAVRALSRQPSRFATLFPAEILSVSLDDGSDVRLFLKHLGPEQPGNPDKQRRDREVQVYETLLRDRDLPVAQYYGSRWNAGTGRHEVYLEYVDDWPLKWHGLEYWPPAAKRLAHLHAHFATRRQDVRACDSLLRLDESYLAAWARRAVEALVGQSAELAHRLELILPEYGPAYELLARQPVTLVHNDLAPKNVLTDRSQSPPRIVIIDWEMAGVGCGLLDLVHLKYGLDTAPAEEMLGIYRSELAGSDLLPQDEREFRRLLAACELHKTLYRLAHSPAWDLPAATLAHWLTEAEDFLRVARGGGDS
jgi:aminoglycoside phosphotransferase (APT) family kinase protein